MGTSMKTFAQYTWGVKKSEQDVTMYWEGNIEYEKY